MKKMIYKNSIDIIKEVLDEGIIEGYRYTIVSYGSHPCAYVYLPKGHKYYGVHYANIDIECHGGITYSEDHLWTEPDSRDNWILGWDYAHCGDFYMYYCE